MLPGRFQKRSIWKGVWIIIDANAIVDSEETLRFLVGGWFSNPPPALNVFVSNGSAPNPPAFLVDLGFGKRVTNAVLRDQGFQDNFIFLVFCPCPFPPLLPLSMFWGRRDWCLDLICGTILERVVAGEESKQGKKYTPTNSKDTPFLGQETLKHCVGWFFQIQKAPRREFWFLVGLVFELGRRRMQGSHGSAYGLKYQVNLSLSLSLSWYLGLLSVGHCP